MLSSFFYEHLLLKIIYKGAYYLRFEKVFSCFGWWCVPKSI